MTSVVGVVIFHIETGLRTEYVVLAEVVAIDLKIIPDAEVTFEERSSVEGNFVVEVMLSLVDWVFVTVARGSGFGGSVDSRGTINSNAVGVLQPEVGQTVFGDRRVPSQELFFGDVVPPGNSLAIVALLDSMPGNAVGWLSRMNWSARLTVLSEHSGDYGPVKEQGQNERLHDSVGGCKNNIAQLETRHVFVSEMSKIMRNRDYTTLSKPEGCTISQGRFARLMNSIIPRTADTSPTGCW